LKNGEILIFDEPTNNLDDNSVIIFQKIVNKLSKEKIIIIVSHDKRLASDNYLKIKIIDTIISQQSNKNFEKDIKSQSFTKLNIDFIGYIRNTFKNLFKFKKFLYILLSLCLTILFVSSLFIFKEIAADFNVNPFIEDGYSEVYLSPRQCGTDDCKELKVQAINIEQINQLNRLNGVEVIISKTELYPNFYQFNPLGSACFSGSNLFEYDNTYYQYYLNKWSRLIVGDDICYSFANGILEKSLTTISSNIITSEDISIGNYPKIFSNEIVIPYSLAVILAVDDFDKIINETISLNNSEYKIVGILNKNQDPFNKEQELNSFGLETIINGHITMPYYSYEEQIKNFEDYYNNIYFKEYSLYNDFDDYFMKHQNGITTIYVNYDLSIYSPKEISDIIDNTIPNSLQLSKYDFEINLLQKNFEKYSYYFFIAFGIFILVLITIFYSGKEIKKIRKEEYLLTYSYGYSKFMLTILTLVEDIIDLIISIFIGFLIILLIFYLESFTEKLPLHIEVIMQIYLLMASIFSIIYLAVHIIYISLKQKK